MAVVGNYAGAVGQNTTMHPFFKPALARETGPSLEQKNKNLDDPLKHADENLQHNIRKDGKESGVSPNGSGFITYQNTHERRDDNEDTENDVDLNLERRKRRKTTPFEGNETATSPNRRTLVHEDINEDGLAVVKLQEAASYGSGAQETIDLEAGTMPLPRTPSGASPVNLAIRKSPRKTPLKLSPVADALNRTPTSTIRPNTRSSSSGSKVVSTLGSGVTPKKKVIKLTSKGKLLSSPPSVSPSSKLKIENKTTKSERKAVLELRRTTCIGYGTDYETRKKIGSQIDTILSRKALSITRDQAKMPKAPRITHPFFLGKPAKTTKPDVILVDDGSVAGENFDAAERSENMTAKPTDWKDLGFKKNQTSQVKFLDTIRPLWPPKDMQHLGVADFLPIMQHKHQASPIRRRSSKSRKDLLSVSDDEDVLQRYAASLEHHRGQLRDTYPLPQKVIFSRQEMMDIIKGQMSSTAGNSPGSIALQETYPGAFAHLELLFYCPLINSGVPGVAQSWLSKSAPTETNQVLQIQSKVLRKWLASHQVHQTATKLSAAPTTKTARKRRRKKKADEMDDFIASSDDEDVAGLAATKNALLITGPNGCGKTASVYAAAKELDFEVFEIHPGMRRSAKDIFDKVGDMTQNHLVHKAAQLDRKCDSTPGTAIIDLSSGEGIQSSENAMKSFLGGKNQTTRDIMLSQKSQNRKQSLILLEEVDILFEEDRGFWSGVIQLIEQSKRPAVLTCNDPASIPVEDLPLYLTLEYEKVPVDVAVDYILMLAAVEGHWLDREAIYSLYLTKNMDLRATISELDFWCQMAVGSEKAGLDWTIERQPSNEAMKANGEKLKLFSKDTYMTGMGLVPRTLFIPSLSVQGALMQHSRDEFDIPLQYWHNKVVNRKYRQSTAEQSMNTSTFDKRQQNQDLTDARSVLDLLSYSEHTCSDTEYIQHGAIGAELCAMILAALNPQAPPLSVTDIASAHLQVNAASSQFTPGTILAAFGPLMAEKPQFPPSLGRLAPSLDTSCAALMSDIAPYVRSIVRYDQRLEEQRYVLAGGVQTTKVRKTRAARAALEGGNKANTRDEKWFPNKTDYAAVLRTGGSWPSWSDEIAMPCSDESPEGSESKSESRTESSATSPTAHIEMSDGA